MEVNQSIKKKDWGTIIIGAGQAGLATGYHLSKLNEDFLIVDAAASVGSAWEHRWDSLRLFTPSQYNGLPGFPFPAASGTFPSKDEMAEYLRNYAKRFDLPIYLNLKVKRMWRNQSGFELDTADGIMKCKRVVVATGTNPSSRIPDFAEELDKSVYQIHSSQYINPDSFPDGKVLVVGAGTSGVEIAIELSSFRQTLISGNPTFHIPNAIFRYAGKLYWWFASNILTVKTPIGRKAKQKIVKGGGPLINISAEDLTRAGVERLPKVLGVENGLPKLEDGRVLSVSSIIWCTGFKPDFSWIELKVTDENGWPITHRGVSTKIEGMYFVGMLFQFGLTSGLVGGVGRDAAFVVNHIARHINVNSST
jgi:putative flavoprotein involved in K+ transport